METAITKDDGLIIYSFPKYSELNKTLANIALEREAKLVVIIDSDESGIFAEVSEAILFSI